MKIAEFSDVVDAVRATRERLVDGYAFLMAYYRAPWIRDTPHQYTTPYAEGCGTPCCIAGHAAEVMCARAFTHARPRDPENEQDFLEFLGATDIAHGLTPPSLRWLFNVSDWSAHLLPEELANDQDHWTSAGRSLGQPIIDNSVFDTWAAAHPDEARRIGVAAIDHWLEMVEAGGGAE